MERILALDVGEARIGVALSDPLGITAQPWGVVSAKGKDKGLDEIESIIKDNQVGSIVLGLPSSLHGGMSPQGEKIKKWAKGLEQRFPECPISFWDERYSTQQAIRTLSGSKKKDREKKGNRDVISAVLILQSYLTTK